MSTFDLTQKVKIVNPNASSDSQYGPYNSIGEALTATENLRELGRTVGIVDDGIIVEYWFKEGITDNDLIPKTTGSNGSGEFFKEITKDGEFTAEKIEGGADDGKYRFKIKGDETLEWAIGDTDYVYNLDSNDEWTFIADALGLGVERRIDAVSYGNDGQIHYWKGTETGQASYPNVPETHILKTFVTITEDGIEVSNVGFIKKSSEAFIQVVPTTSEIKLNIDNNRNFVVNASDEVTIVGVVKTITNGSTTTDTNWSGSDLHIYRKIGSNNVKIKHHDIPNWTAKGYTLYFPDGQDYDMEEGEMLTFKIMQPGTLITNSSIMAFPIYIFAGSSKVGGSTSDDISNESTVTGANLTEALDELNNNKEDKTKLTFIEVTSSTAAATAAKVGNLTDGTVPINNGLYWVTFTNANTANNPTLALTSGGTAYPIRVGNANATSVSMTGTRVFMIFDNVNSCFQLLGSQRNSDADTIAQWSVTTTVTTATSQAVAINSSYIANHASTQINYTLPATAAVGSTVRVQGLGAGGFRITAPSGDDIVENGVSTGTAGFIESSNQYDSVLLTCIVANTTWLVINRGINQFNGLTGDVTAGSDGVTTLEKISSIAEAGKDQIAKVLPDGTIEGEDVFELWVYDDTVTPYDLTDLQTNYPTSAGRAQGFEVRCRLLTPPTTYRKESENDSVWIKIEGSNVV